MTEQHESLDNPCYGCAWNDRGVCRKHMFGQECEESEE